MKFRIKLKPKAKEVIEVIITSAIIGIVGFMIACAMSARFHSEKVIEMQKKTELSGTQISRNNDFTK